MTKNETYIIQSTGALPRAIFSFVMSGLAFYAAEPLPPESLSKVFIALVCSLCLIVGVIFSVKPFYSIEKMEW